MTFKNSQNSRILRILKMLMNFKNKTRCREKNADRMKIFDVNVPLQLVLEENSIVM